MKHFIGTKLIKAEPMTRGEYNDFRGWKLPSDEDGNDEGYLVEYLDGGKANVNGYEGYVSWSPKEQFENAHQTDGNMSFGHAVELMRRGNRVARTGWNGNNMFVYYVPANSYPASENAFGTMVGIFDNDMVPYREYMAIKTAQGDVATWAPSCSDVLANDWSVVVSKTTGE